MQCPPGDLDCILERNRQRFGWGSAKKKKESAPSAGGEVGFSLAAPFKRAKARVEDVAGAVSDQFREGEAGPSGFLRGMGIGATILGLNPREREQAATPDRLPFAPDIAEGTPIGSVADAIESVVADAITDPVDLFGGLVARGLATGGKAVAKGGKAAVRSLDDLIALERKAATSRPKPGGKKAALPHRPKVSAVEGAPHTESPFASELFPRARKGPGLEDVQGSEDLFPGQVIDLDRQPFGVFEDPDQLVLTVADEVGEPRLAATKGELQRGEVSRETLIQASRGQDVGPTPGATQAASQPGFPSFEAILSGPPSRAAGTNPRMVEAAAKAGAYTDEQLAQLVATGRLHPVVAAGAKRANQAEADLLTHPLNAPEEAELKQGKNLLIQLLTDESGFLDVGLMAKGGADVGHYLARTGGNITDWFLSVASPDVFVRGGKAGDLVWNIQDAVRLANKEAQRQAAASPTKWTQKQFTETVRELERAALREWRPVVQETVEELKAAGNVRSADNLDYWWRVATGAKGPEVEWVSKVTGTLFDAMLAGAPDSALRNFGQLVSVFEDAPGSLMRTLRDYSPTELRTIAKKAGLAEGVEDILQPELVDDVLGDAKKLIDPAHGPNTPQSQSLYGKVRHGLRTTFSFSEAINRGASYVAFWDSKAKELGIPTRQLLDAAMEGKLPGLDQEAFKFVLRHQYGYNSIERPVAFSGNTGRLMGLFLRYPAGYVQNTLTYAAEDVARVAKAKGITATAAELAKVPVSSRLLRRLYIIGAVLGPQNIPFSPVEPEDVGGFRGLGEAAGLNLASFFGLKAATQGAISGAGEDTPFVTMQVLKGLFDAAAREGVGGFAREATTTVAPVGGRTVAKAMRVAQELREGDVIQESSRRGPFGLDPGGVFDSDPVSATTRLVQRFGDQPKAVKDIIQQRLKEQGLGSIADIATAAKKPSVTDQALFFLGVGSDQRGHLTEASNIIFEAGQEYKKAREEVLRRVVKGELTHSQAERELQERFNLRSRPTLADESVKKRREARVRAK